MLSQCPRCNSRFVFEVKKKLPDAKEALVDRCRMCHWENPIIKGTHNEILRFLRLRRNNEVARKAT